MAKQSADKSTADLWGHGPGRPPKQNALTGAERARRYREKRKLFPVTRNENSAECEWCAAERTGTCRICGEGA
ncbi:conserved hypothetical protein [Burkholderia cenocepacia]|uniref:hypothetical protein n=1 Tax=Burkholderia cenocepacia TaxID=95486 RepID=UPI00192C70BA|nr:hypothetical protein [Burkholderia cenocepacia]CAD9228384.1 conserved hypothetical protein [Burkholderia cenocepacia]